MRALLLVVAGCWHGAVAEQPADRVSSPAGRHHRLPARAVALVGEDLWVAMGTCDDATIWRTPDRGGRWAALDITDITAVDRIVGGEHPDDVAVLGATCLGHEPSTRYHLWVSDEHGWSWAFLDPPPGFRGGFVTMAFVRRELRFSWRNGAVTGNWQLDASSREWAEIPQPASGPPQSVTLGGVTYRPSPDGLIVETATQSMTVYPR